MRHNTGIAFAAACFGLLLATTSALSTPVQKPQLTREQIAERLATAQKPATGWPALVSEARKYIGTNPTDRRRLWCATFMNFVLAKLGYAGTNSDAAKSFALYGRRILTPRIGAIAVLTRGRRGGHVGVVSGVDSQGNPIIISGNHNDRVGEGIYPRSRVIAYVMPTERRPLTTQLAARSLATPVTDKSINSPIAALIAAIEAEHARAEKPAHAAPPPPPARRSILLRPPVRAHVVQQLPAREAPRARVRAQAHAGSPLEPLLTKLFGPDDRAALRAHYRARIGHAPARRIAVNVR